MVGRRTTRMPGSVMSTRNMLRPSRTGPSARVRAVVMHQSALCAPVTSTLPTREDEAVTVGDRRRRLRAEVAARVLLGVRDAHLDLAPFDERHEARSLLVARERAERVARERDRGVDERGVEGGDEEVEPRAFGRWHRDAQVPELARGVVQRSFEGLRETTEVFGIGLDAVACHLALEEHAHRRRERVVLPTEPEVHCGSLHAAAARPKNMLRRCRPLTASCATSCASPKAASRC